MKYRVLCLGLLLTLPSFSTLAQDSRDTAFLLARDAFRAGDRNKLERATSQLGNHELAPYAENYRLRMWMDQGDSASLRAFLERNDKTYVAEKLRADWIRWLGKRAAWNEIDTEYPRLLAPEPDVSCYAQQARLARDDRSVLDEAEKLWTTQLETPEPCRPVLDAVVNAQRLSVDDVWTRARKWRADWALEGAIYAETIPFSETRDYVKKVLSNAVYYSALFNGKPDSLKARLGVVAARTSDTPKDADLP